MVYGSEVILPTDIDYGSPWVQAFDKEGNDTKPQRRQGQTRGSTRSRCHAIGQVPTWPQAVSRPMHTRRAFRLGISSYIWPRTAEASPSYQNHGRSIRPHLSPQAWLLQAGDARWHAHVQCVEHRTTMPLLPLVFLSMAADPLPRLGSRLPLRGWG